MKHILLRALKFIRITDENGDLSITNILVMALLGVIIVKIYGAHEITLEHLAGVLTAIFGYNAKRSINKVAEVKAVEKQLEVKAVEKQLEVEKLKLQVNSRLISVKDVFRNGDFSVAPKEVLDNVSILTESVDQLLKIVGAETLYKGISSGYRDPIYNKKVGGSPNSAHSKGMALDLIDTDGKIKALIDEKSLEKCGLFMEHPSRTPTWCHLQIRPTKRRIFLP